jgi:hypothetical protein
MISTGPSIGLATGLGVVLVESLAGTSTAFSLKAEEKMRAKTDNRMINFIFGSKGFSNEKKINY